MEGEPDHEKNNFAPWPAHLAVGGWRPSREKVLTETQLDGITAGIGGDGVQQSLHDNSVANSIDNVHVNGSLPRGSSGGSLNNLYQSNTTINNN